MRRFPLVLAVIAAGCASTDDTTPGGTDADTDTDVDTDVPPVDTDTTTDTDTDTGPVYDCGAFTETPAGWVPAAGLRAVVVADGGDGLQQPVGLTFAGGGFGGLLYVADQAAATIWSIDTATGETVDLVDGADFPTPPTILTAVVRDEVDGAFGGDLFVADSVTDGDQDTVIYRIDVASNVSVFTQAPGPGLDSVYAMAFAPVGSALEGLYASGDTDGAFVDWGVFDAGGIGTPFSEVAGVEGIAFDPTGVYGEGPIAARPATGGYAGDDSITPLGFDGIAGTPIATGLAGIHANVVAPAGLFAGEMIAASWATGEILRVSPTGVITTLVSGLALTNYDANVLAVSPDGRTLLVADRLASRVVCIEEE